MGVEELCVFISGLAQAKLLTSSINRRVRITAISFPVPLAKTRQVFPQLNQGRTLEGQPERKAHLSVRAPALYFLSRRTTAVRNLRVLLALALVSVATWAVPQSGPAIGDHLPAHHPQHITGPDAGTDTCPV